MSGWTIGRSGRRRLVTRRGDEPADVHASTRVRQPCKRQSPRQERSHGVIRRAPAKRIGRGSEAQKPDRIEVRVGRLSDLLYPLRPPITPTKMAGARTRSINRQVGPDEQKCSLNEEDA